MRSPFFFQHWLIAFCALLALASVARADEEAAPAPLERVTFEAKAPSGRSLGEKTIDGQVVRELAAGGLLLLDRGGRIWPITPDRLVKRENTGKPFTPYSQKEMAEALRAEFGEDVLIVKTDHYVLCSEASLLYTKWAGGLFERLMGAFETLWDEPPLEYTEPRFPLTAIILKDKDRFQEYAVKESGSSVLNALGYYSTLTNRMVMYDLTGGQRPRNILQVRQRLLKQIGNVTTIVHEATHQVAFNTNVHTRLAPNPFWLIEGMAMYFETPDLRSPNGWRTVGSLNRTRLRTYQEYLRLRRQPDSLKTMIASDDKFHDEKTALDAYSEAWALSYFLIGARREKYIHYLEEISRMQMLEEKSEEERIALFEKYFGEIKSVKKSMIRYLSRRIR